MAKIRWISLKCLCLLQLFLNNIKSEKTKSFFIDFEQIKYDLFLESYAKLSEKIAESVDNNECLKELNAIQSALNARARELWALQIVDAWGRIPSGIFTGNTHDFGSYSQCLEIKRNGKAYKTQYCLGRLFFDLEEKIALKVYRYDLNKIAFPDMVHVDNVPRIDPRRPYVTFGACVPAVCSFEIFEPIINDLIPKHPNNFSIQLSKDTCQTGNNDPELTNREIATFGLLFFVCGLILISTSYDVLCTIYNRKKSQLLLAFSVYRNGRKLFSLNDVNSSDTIQCLHGIRVISTMWIILGHTFSLYLVMPIQNRIAHDAFLGKYSNMLIFGGFISVDSFFVLSGLLVSIGILKHLEKYGRLNVLQLYLHRYLRLTPLLAVSVLVTVSLYRFGETGPLWYLVTHINRNQCEKYWWSTLLYIQNYVNPDDICFVHSWYLSVDMQLFLIAPAIVYLIYRLKRKALIPLTLLLLGSSIYFTLNAHIKHNLTTLLSLPGNKLETAYVPTHTRYSPWLIGVIAGYFLFESPNRKIQIPKVINIFGWMLSLIAMTAVIFANYPLQQLDNKFSPIVYGLYDAISRIVWSISLCYIIFACVHGSGGLVNRFLSHPLWQPLSRLSYSIYLFHFIVIGCVVGTHNYPPHFTETAALNIFIVNYVITVFVSIAGTLSFESPIIAIEKILFGASKKMQPTGAGIQKTDKDNNNGGRKKKNR